MSFSDQEIQSIVDEYTSTTLGIITPPNVTVAVTETKESSDNGNIRQTIKKNMAEIGNIDIHVEMRDTMMRTWFKKYEYGEVTRALMIERIVGIHGAMNGLALRRGQLIGELKGLGVYIETGASEIFQSEDSI